MKIPLPSFFPRPPRSEDFITWEMVERDDGKQGIKCRVCKLTSWSSEDVKYRYCGNCNRFHDEMVFERLDKKHASLKRSVRRMAIPMMVLNGLSAITFVAGWLAWVFLIPRPSQLATLGVPWWAPLLVSMGFALGLGPALVELLRRIIRDYKDFRGKD